MCEVEGLRVEVGNERRRNGWYKYLGSVRIEWKLQESGRQTVDNRAGSYEAGLAVVYSLVHVSVHKLGITTEGYQTTLDTLVSGAGRLVLGQK